MNTSDYRASLVQQRLRLLEGSTDYSEYEAELRAVSDTDAESTRLGHLSRRLLNRVSDYLCTGDITLSQALLALEDPVVSVKACGLEALSRMARHDDSAADSLSAFANSMCGRTAVFGCVRLEHIAVASLLRAGSDYAVTLARRLMESRFSDDCALRTYLAGEGLA